MDRRDSNRSSADSASRNDRDGFIPMTLDPSPRTRPTPMSRHRSDENAPNDTLPGSEQLFRDDFRDLLAGSSSSRSASKDRSRRSPRTTQQDLGRQPSGERTHGIRQKDQSMNQSPAIDSSSPAIANFERVRKPPPPAPPAELDATDGRFQLQEAPKIRRKSSGSKHTSKGSAGTTSPTMALAGQTEGTPLIEQGATAPSSVKTVTEQIPDFPKRKASNRRSPLSLGTNTTLAERPTRQDSLRKTATKQNIPRKELPRSESDILNGAGRVSTEDHSSSPSEKSAKQDPASASIAEETMEIDGDSFALPPRSSSRPAPNSGVGSASTHVAERDDFTAPREAPVPPPMRHKPNESVSSIQSEHFGTGSPYLGDDHVPHFLSEEEDARYNRDEDIEHPGIFRKVSKAVRHGRSYSDKVGSPSQKWHKASRNGSIDISSPMLNTPDGQEDPVQLRNKLRFSQQRIAELETEKSTLQEHANSSADMRQVNAELRTKRDTMAFLDTQREMVIRELETMTDQLAKAKDSEGPIDLEVLQSDAMKHFTQQLHQLRDNIGDQIEELMRKKNDLTNEIANLIQMKDKGFQEYESLSAKNHGLMDHNNQLTQNIQLLYKQGRQPVAPAQPMPPPSGLGIYTSNLKDKPEGHSAALSIDTSNSQLSGETEIEPATVLTAPQVVNIRKGQPKKFSWKKGGENITKNVKRGFKGAFASDRPSALKEEQFAEGAPYNSIPAGEAPMIGDRPVGQRNASDSSRPGPLQREMSNQGGNWGFSTLKGGAPLKVGRDWKKAPGEPADISKSSQVIFLYVRERHPANTSIETGLFGSDLSARCEYEHRLLPLILTRCIEEVESRGMDIEGIYRKSGSFSQVKQVQQGFEEDPNNCDISDVDIDIHSVTSALKQWLRKLAVPLISFESYDEMLDAIQAPDEGERIERLHVAVSRLPPRHKDTLEFLIVHLVRVMAQQGDNFVSQFFLTEAILLPTDISIRWAT